MKCSVFARGAFNSIGSAVTFTLLLSGCHSEAPPVSPEEAAALPAAAPAESVAAPALPAAAPAESAAVTPAGVAPVAPAARYCTPGPHPAPLSGAISATRVPNSEPTALDPKDKVFHLYEGAVWLDGALYFSDFLTSPGFPSRMLRHTPGAALSVALPDSGTNGLSLDPTGRELVGARHKSKGITALGASAFAPRELVSTFEGRPFNSPNDLVFRSDGTLFFTDPDFQAGASKDQPTTNVYRVGTDGVVTVIDNTIKNPNGIALSLDERTLYVAGNLEQGYLKSYPIDEAGRVGSGSVLVAPVVVPDGLTVDCAGNIYVTEHTQKRIRVFTPTGTELGQIVGLEHNVTNAAFGGAERKTLYITTTGALYEVHLPVAGLPY